MSKKTIINSAYIERIQHLIDSKRNSELKSEINKLHFADIAEVIELISLKEAQFIYNLVDEKKSASILVELEEDTRENLLSYFTPKEIAQDVIGKLPSDDAVDVMSELSKEKKEAVLAFVENEELANNISDLLSYHENTAGALMATELIKVNENWNTIQCLKEMKKQAENIKEVHTIYAVDNKNRLLGSMSLRKLLLMESNTIVKNIIRRNIVAVKVSDEAESIANIMDKYNLITIPVIDDESKLIGRITLDDVLSLVKEEAEKDYQMASGISEDVEINDNIWELTRARLPWLIIGMIGGLMGAKIIGIFNIEKYFELAFFIPLIAAMAGNVGVQSAAIVVQGLANDSLKMENILQKLIKELGVGLLNGMICSIVMLITVYLFGFGASLSITVSISLLAVIVFAALFGTFVPLTLKRYNIDPALATGPFITTVNDIIGLFIYFLIGQTIL